MLEIYFNLLGDFFCRYDGDGPVPWFCQLSAIIKYFLVMIVPFVITDFYSRKKFYKAKARKLFRSHKKFDALEHSIIFNLGYEYGTISTRIYVFRFISTLIWPFWFIFIGLEVFSSLLIKYFQYNDDKAQLLGLEEEKNHKIQLLYEKYYKEETEFRRNRIREEILKLEEPILLLE
jgi:hypothetical protein